MKILDPVCGMIVDVEQARDQGLTIERPEREYGFCSHGCLTTFAKAPAKFIPEVEEWLAAPHEGDGDSMGGHKH